MEHRGGRDTRRSRLPKLFEKLEIEKSALGRRSRRSSARLADAGVDSVAIADADAHVGSVADADVGNPAMAAGDLDIAYREAFDVRLAAIKCRGRSTAASAAYCSGRCWRTRIKPFALPRSMPCSRTTPDELGLCAPLEQAIDGWEQVLKEQPPGAATYAQLARLHLHNAELKRRRTRWKTLCAWSRSLARRWSLD